MTSTIQYDLSTATWHRSRYSDATGDCLEVAAGLPGIVPVRDSKRPDGPALTFRATAWARFVRGVNGGTFSGS
ncbi:DUF397 domain-containing protein [Streptomyces sp. BBFR2]|uniref:DUF397 domain-containing protein n=1 Tax=Streptomyces sp. BBFR2 TaxID=3372854 RepID=UPI0037D997FB